MAQLNYKHLRYFWTVAKTGSIARAAEQLHLTPQSISGQLSEFADSLGVQLFRRRGRSLELTDTGRRVMAHADQVFAAGEDLLRTVSRQGAEAPEPFRVGVADSVSKAIGSRLLAPALALRPAPRLLCREGRLARLLAELAIHQLDLVLADRPLPPGLHVRGFSHLLGESPMALYQLAPSADAPFPACLDGAPLLLPGEDFAIRPRLQQWLERHGLRPRIVGEFDDSAMMKAFAASGAGAVFVPAVIGAEVAHQYGLHALGTLDEVVEQVYAISTERHISHPATVAISAAARQTLFA